MESTIRRKAQDEIATITARLEELRSVEVVEGSDEQAAAQLEIESLIQRSDKATATMDAQDKLDAKIVEMRSKLAGVASPEPRAVEAPAVHTSRSVIGRSSLQMWERSGVSADRVANIGEHFRAMARGEVRGAFTTATEAANSMGGKKPTYNTKGAELVYEDVYRGVMGILEETSVGLQVANVMGCSSNQLTLPRSDDAIDANWYLENTEIAPVLIKTSQTIIPINKLGARVQVSNELIEDSVYSVATLVAQKVAFAFAVEIDQAWIDGNAGAGITGLTTAVTQSVTIGAGGLTPADVAKVHAAINPYAVNPVWVLSPEGVGLLKAAAAGAIGTDITAPSRLSIFGIPVYICKQFTGKNIGIFADFKQLSTVAVRSNGLTIAASRERAIEYDQTVFVATQRLGIGMTGASYGVLLKKP
jgi:HK97 family phage major capsid protein